MTDQSNDPQSQFDANDAGLPEAAEGQSSAAAQPNDPQPQYEVDEAGLPKLPKEKSSRTNTIIIIVAAVFGFLCCVLPIVIIILLSLLGPAIGNVFSEIIDDLVTPTPSVILLMLRGVVL